MAMKQARNVDSTCSFNVIRHRRVQGGPKSKPLPNDQKIVLHRIKACQ